MDNSSDSSMHTIDMEKREDTASTEMQSLADNVVKRSHSLELQGEVHQSTNENSKERLQAAKIYCMDSQSLAITFPAVTTANTPKRHHPSSPVISCTTDKTSANNASQSNSEDLASSAASLSTNSAASTPLEDLEQEKPVTNCDMATTTPLLNEDSYVNGQTPPSSLRQSGGNTTVDAAACGTKTAACVSTGNNRNGSLLPRPSAMGLNPSTSSRTKTVSRSKRHSSRTNLYIRGLPKSMSENDLVSLVPDASAIRSVKLVVNNDGEGYGFIDFVTNEAALIAMQHIKLQNSGQYVNFAYESEKDPLNVYVTNIPESWNSDNVENLKQIFAPYGKITSALVMTRRSTNTCTGTGFVRYLTSEEAQRAIDGIRKAKITLPGAKRPLELKLADRQRAREHKSESIGSENTTLPLFQQFMHDETQRHLCQALKTQHHNQMAEDIFNVAPLPERTMFDQAKMAGYVTSGASLMNSSSVDITPTSSDEIPAPAPPQLTTPTVMPVAPAVAAATAAALATPLYQFPCIPWIQQDSTAAHGNPTAAYIHPQIAATVPQKAVTATAPLDLNSLAAIYQMASLNALSYGATAPAQSFDMVLPLVNGQLNEHPIDATNLNPFGLNQSLWPKACFFG
ncbi:RNA-binding motif, single-stranded-interacting protein 1 [Echinococcus granulosus]|uniref:RNA binding motif single stranded interacting n=1 Tax=Echinococcus granulosus TaxID=6210 RepID=A0A068WD22_ECHGR|nr:RNA-binding motif, single-stranded-interacting protein 1 [Echinococcus granulosus]CDS15567.1 RNA binding motif single stranded interacting [Echinococcus granulosus]